MLALQQQFLADAQHGISQEYAEELFERMIAFASKYGFAEAMPRHLPKRHMIHVAATLLSGGHYCSVLNNEPMGFYAPRIVVADARGTAWRFAA